MYKDIQENKLSRSQSNCPYDNKLYTQFNNLSVN